MLTDEQEAVFIETVLQRARVPMAKHLGTRPRGYDAADEIATEIAAGVRRALRDLGLRRDPDETLRRARIENGRLAEPIRGIGDVGTMVLYPEPYAVLVVDELNHRAFFLPESEAKDVT